MRRRLIRRECCGVLLGLAGGDDKAVMRVARGGECFGCGAGSGNAIGPVELIGVEREARLAGMEICGVFIIRTRMRRRGGRRRILLRLIGWVVRM